MKTLFATLLVLLLCNGALAQSPDTPTISEPSTCDWASWYNSPQGMATQGGYLDVASTWDCSNSPATGWIWANLDFNFFGTQFANSGDTDPCNPRYPIGRAIHAAVLLGYSGSTNQPTCDLGGGNVLDWALCFSASRYANLEASCYGSNTAFATTMISPLGDYTVVYPGAMYEQEVDRFSSTLFHESRHFDCLHNANDGDCPRGASCDESWGDGCPWPSDRPGANRYQASWLSWYASHGTRGTTALRTDAAIRGNEILSAGFHHDPCIRLAPDGTGMDVKMPGC